MIIHQPKIIEKEDYCLLETTFETQGENKVLWYKVDLAYKNSLTTDNCDSALVGLLVLAMINNEDIQIKGAISSRLYYTVTTYLVPALHLSNKDYNKIKIISDSINAKNLNTSKNTATGLSCGIDSFATIASHANTNKDFTLKYLTFFNAGSHGFFNGEIAEKIYKNRFLNASNCAKRMGLPLITVDANVFDLVSVSFQKLHSLYHMSCALVLQNLISNYYYASAFRFDYFKLNKFDTSDWDIMLLNFLQTESMQFYSSMAQSTRLERTSVVSNFEPSYYHLDVCTSLSSNKKINCSKCEKCMRTQLSLELMDKLEHYNAVFNLDIYKENRDDFIINLINTKDKNQINQELYNLLESKALITSNQNLKSKFNKLKNLAKKVKKAFN